MWRNAITDPPKAKVNVVFIAGFGKTAGEKCFGHKDNDDQESNLWWDKTEFDDDGNYSDLYTVMWWFDLPPDPVV